MNSIASYLENGFDQINKRDENEFQKEILTIASTANIFKVIFTVFSCVPISTVILLNGLHLIAAPSTVE